MSRPSRPGLRVEALEDRTVPTAIGSPWPNAEALTLSFAGDGTPVAGTTSQAGALPAGWQLAVLKAFQTWAVQTNANVALVADGGAAFGTPGQAQGDFRFGDIRVGSAPLSADALANASPYDWSIGTWSGDVLFNSNAAFSVGGTATAPDLYTIALHEAGHVFGLEHSTSPASVMYENYLGARTGLSAADIATIQSYYGARQPDAYEGSKGNNTLATATPVETVSGAARVTADVGSNSDVDDYALLDTSLLGTLRVTVKTSGISLLTPKVTVLNQFGQVVATGTAAGPGQDVTLTLPKSLLNLSYTVQVRGATNDVFGIGGYQMSVVRADGLVLPHALAETLAGNSLLGAVPLDGLLDGPDDGVDADAAVDSSSDVDYYSLTVPPTTDAAPKALVVSVTNTAGKAPPALAVLDATGRPVPFQILDADSSTLTIQVTQIRRGATYYIKVSNQTTADATGKYHLSADLEAPVEIDYTKLASGSVSAAAPVDATLTVNASRLFEFALVTDAGATLTVRDSTGAAVLTLTASESGSTNAAVYLPPGAYTVEITAPGASDFWAGVRDASDPVGPYASGTATTYSSTSSDSSTYTTSSSDSGTTDSGTTSTTTQPAPSSTQVGSSSSSSSTTASQPTSSTYFYKF